MDVITSLKNQIGISHTQIKRTKARFYYAKLLKPYGFVEKMEPLAINALLFIFRISLTHSAKSSG